MKTKINIQLLGVAAVAIIVTLVMAVSVFYEFFREEVMTELKNNARILVMSGLCDTSKENEVSKLLDHIRVTLIDETGTVQYDSLVSPDQMDNHGQRPEIVEALEEGEGSIIRRSATLGKSTFYYAVKQKDGTILRVSKDADSIWSIFKNAFPVICGISVLLFICCMFLAHFLTRSLVTPIEQMAKNIETCESISTYKELVPFISTIKKQHEDILKSAKMRQEFTANVSHELKTPLTSISGYAELIESGMATEDDVRRFAAEIHRNSRRLLNLINDIIKLSELDASEVQVDFSRVNLLDIIAESVEMLHLQAEKYQVKIIMDGEDCYVNANKSMMEEVVYNLCDNAIRYNNKDGKVFVTVFKEGEGAVIKVRDTGIGITPENQKRIFERFYRVDKSRSKAIGGTGLGLAIVKHIVAQHGARIEVESQLGVGTEIRIYFDHLEA